MGSPLITLDGYDDTRDAEKKQRGLRDSRIYSREMIIAPAPLRDIWLPADEFYGIVQQWRDAFLAEWEFLPKMTGDEYWGTPA